MSKFCFIDLNVMKIQQPDAFCRYCVDFNGPCPTEEVIRLFMEMHPILKKGARNEKEA